MRTYRMKKGQRRWSGLVAGSALATLLAFSVGVVFASHTSFEVPICCSWNEALNDSGSDGSPDLNGIADLTYSISGGSSLDQSTVQAAVEEWETAVSGGGYVFELNQVDPGTGENIKISLRRGGGVVAGSTKRKFNQSGFVKSTRLSISLKAFGVINDQATLAEVTRHETGHSLGLNHANFADLMDPTVGGVNTIRGCDVEGVAQSNHWKLADDLSTPHMAHVNHVGCNADSTFNSLPPP